MPNRVLSLVCKGHTDKTAGGSLDIGSAVPQRIWFTRSNARRFEVVWKMVYIRRGYGELASNILGNACGNL